MKKGILLLGSSGSIGKSTVDVIRSFPEEFELCALCVNSSAGVAAKQAAEFGVPMVGVADESADISIFTDKTKVFRGREGIKKLCRECGADIAVAAIVGIAGLEAVDQCISCGMDIALANKETLVAGGAYIMRRAREQGVAIYPVDSEHSAIFQCLQGVKREELKSIILTCSGGPFRGKKLAQLADITPQDALKHPTWSMGAKISIDSATLMNKGLEVIEARWLFDIAPDDIKVLVHPQSIVHSMIELRDNAVLAQLGAPDMRLAIQYALTYPQRLDGSAKRLDFECMRELTFESADTDTFRCLRLGYAAIGTSDAACVALNAANEAAVELFLRKAIKFTQIADIIEKYMEMAAYEKCEGVEAILALDARIKAGVKTECI